MTSNSGSQPARGSPFDPECLSAWLAELPLGCLGETARQLFHKLGELADSPLAARHRWRSLEQMTPTSKEILKALRRHYLADGAGAEATKFSRLSQTFYHRLGMIAVQAAEAGGSRLNLVHKRRRQLAFGAAVHYTARRAVVYYQRGTVPPPELWEDLARCVEAGGGLDAPRSVRQPYLALLAFVAADPARLPPTAMEQLFQQLLTLPLSEHVATIQICAGTTEGSWIVAPTGVFKHCAYNGDPAAALHLELSRLAAVWVDVAQNRTHAPAVANSWRGGARAAVRYALKDAERSRVGLATGFDAVFRALPGTSFQEFNTEPDVFQLGTGVAGGFARSFAAGPVRSDALVMDHSEGGCRVAIPDPGALVPVVGDFVAVELQPGQWLPAYVRWQRLEDGAPFIGLEAAGWDACPARIETGAGSVRAIIVNAEQGPLILLETRFENRIEPGHLVQWGEPLQTAALDCIHANARVPAVRVVELRAAPVPAPAEEPAPVTAAPVAPIDEFAPVWASL